LCARSNTSVLGAAPAAAARVAASSAAREIVRSDRIIFLWLLLGKGRRGRRARPGGGVGRAEARYSSRRPTRSPIEWPSDGGEPGPAASRATLCAGLAARPPGAARDSRPAGGPQVARML